MNRPQSTLATALTLFALTTPCLQSSAWAQSTLIPSQQLVSTVPANGDVNPYGVAFVSAQYHGSGPLGPGDVLVANYNNSMNLQGTGTTIMRISKSYQSSVFYQARPNHGMSAALGVLQEGFVLAGSAPTFDGTFATLQNGSLLILDAHGVLKAELTDPKLLQCPWGLTISEGTGIAHVFVSCALSGSITRIDLNVTPLTVTLKSMTRIASGYLHRGDPAALVVGPAGLAYNQATDTLFVASQGEDAVYAVPSAAGRTSDTGTGKLVYQDNSHLHGPLDLAMAPSGDLLIANSDGVNADPNQPSEIVEITQQGLYLGEFPVNFNGIGGAFGVAVASYGGRTIVAATDDLLNTLHLWTIIR